MLDTQDVPLPLIPPMLATTGKPAGENHGGWSFEVKWDGWRALAYIDGGPRVRTRTGRQVSDSLPELTGLIGALDGHRVILDGELVASPDGEVDFYALAPHMMHTGRMARWAAISCPCPAHFRHTREPAGSAVAGEAWAVRSHRANPCKPLAVRKNRV